MINKFEIGQKVEIEIEKIVFGGEGIGRVDGFAIFVPMSVPGDRLEIEIISLKKTYGRGLITRLFILLFYQKSGCLNNKHPLIFYN